MPDGLYLRIVITLLAACQAGIAAALAYPDFDLPNVVKFGLVVASAALAVVLNQVPSWQSAPGAERRLRKRPAVD